MDDAARCSASLPPTSRWPNSVLGSSTPLWITADPIPVPKVSSTMTPVLSRPAPNLSSARPAASASLSTVTCWPLSSLLKNSLALQPIQPLSTLAAVRTTPPVTTPGYVTPTLSVQPNSRTTAATVLLTASGVAGCGVASLKRSPISRPVSRSTTPPLTPLPPTSTPNPLRCEPPSVLGSAAGASEAVMCSHISSSALLW